MVLIVVMVVVVFVLLILAALAAYVVRRKSKPGGSHNLRLWIEGDKGEENEVVLSDWLMKRWSVVDRAEEAKMSEINPLNVRSVSSSGRLDSGKQHQLQPHQSRMGPSIDPGSLFKREKSVHKPASLSL